MLIRQKGFSLIEVMVALLVLSIGLGALLVATTENTRIYQKLQQRFIQNWVELQASNLLKMKMIDVSVGHPYHAVTQIKGIPCYWKVELQNTSIADTYVANISTRMKPYGPWEHQVKTYTMKKP
jgi:prepilin-type N-terminal cleavage/methylation domain-containing protein